MEKRWLISKHDNGAKVRLDEFTGSDNEAFDHIKQVFQKEFGAPHFDAMNNDDIVHSESKKQFIKKFEISKMNGAKIAYE